MYRLIDLEHMQRREAVAACVIETGAGLLVVDPGPTSTLPRLRAGVEALGARMADLAGLLLTHIHLDHAGASGTMARENPGLVVYVHARGAPHMVDPGKLIGSATRLYGDRMEELWGEFAPVPPDRVRVIEGGETITVGRVTLEVAWTPGHAWHHVSYFDAGEGTAFVGDTAGLRTPGLPCVLPVTPPPDFDLEAWLGSIDRLLEWKPREIVLTHFGPASEPDRHLGELREGLTDWAELARESLALPGGETAQCDWFVEQLTGWMSGRAPAELARRYLAGAGPEACWHGLVRYWRKRG